MSTFKDLDLFGSGPHRFRQGVQGEDVVANYILGIPGSGSTPVGTLELDVVVSGRLVADDEAGLWALRDGITAELAHPPVAGALVDSHGRAWASMSLIAYTEGPVTDRGRTCSIAYTATFRRFNSV